MTYPVKLEDLLCFAIYRAGQAFNQLYRPLLDELGLTYPQYLVMVSLWSQDDQSVKELGKSVSLESNTLTPILKRLEAMQLVSRARDAEDERSVRIRLTPEGQALAKKAAHVPGCIAEAAGFSSQDVEMLLEKMQFFRNRVHRKAPTVPSRRAPSIAS